MYRCESWTHKEAWVLKNWCFWVALLEKTLESHLDSKEIKTINLKGNQPWIFIRRTDDEVEALMLWPSDAKNKLTGKDPDAGEDWGQEEKGATEAEMVGWHHWLNGHEFEQSHVKDVVKKMVKDSRVYSSPWGCKEQTSLSNWTTKGIF